MNFLKQETQILSCCPSCFLSGNWEVTLVVELFEGLKLAPSQEPQNCFEVLNNLPSFRVAMATCLYRKNTAQPSGFS